MNDGRVVPTGLSASPEPEDSLGPTGVDPSRIAELESIIRDTLWMACRYAHGRQTYAVGMYNDAARLAVRLGVVEQGIETFAIDGSLSAAMSGLSQQEFGMAWHNWTSPNAIRTHVPRSDSDGSGEASETALAGSTEGDSAVPKAIAKANPASNVARRRG